MADGKIIGLVILKGASNGRALGTSQDIVGSNGQSRISIGSVGSNAAIIVDRKIIVVQTIKRKWHCGDGSSDPEIFKGTFHEDMSR